LSLFLAKRFATLIGTLLFTSIVIFIVLEILPGDPALLILGIDAQPGQLEVLRQQLGLNDPAWTRYWHWIGGMLIGDFGISYAYKVPVWELIAERLQLTIPLAFVSMLLTAFLALVLGVYAAANHNKPGDVAIMATSQIGISIPSFWFAILLILLFAVHLGWVSAGGFPGWGAGLPKALASLILPAISLAIVQAAILARITRSSVLEVMREDFVRTARAKGVSRRAVLWGHVLRNAMIPVITVMGVQFGNLIAGTIVIEQVFTLPGLGRLMFQAINQRDLELIKNVVMLLAVFVISINFIVDMLYVVIDPRLKVHDV
jgi:peptide/nickel transport system permease protein